MKFELKKIGYWPATKVMFIVNLIMGFIGGFFFAIFMGIMVTVMGRLGTASPYFSQDMESIGIGMMLIIYPIFFAFFGAFFYTLLGLIAIFIYNMTARLLGGLEFDFAEIVPKPQFETPTSYHQPPPEGAAEKTIIPPPPPPIEPIPPDMTPPPDIDADEEDKPQVQ